ncbi:PepSY-associated TM helix domain-containing protein [Asticcacaulis solisilvae]|uniref:PepSY-associated TM helix domain-containing protein n=1 Tax=Asticcacaulis solisilvae TaxID=1217274 RepID=UPI003FD82715
MSLFSNLGPNFWRIQLRQWHWISSALCLAGLLLFAATGFTLNHAATLEAKPKTTHVEKTLPAGLAAALAGARDKHPVPAAVSAAVERAVGVDISRRPADVSDEEIYVDLATPGVDASVTLGRDGSLVYERTTRGVVAVLNDLHKGRHAGPVWSLFIDVLAIACVVFALTGLGLLWLYSRNRRITWPLVAAGLAAPLLLYLLLVHA